VSEVSPGAEWAQGGKGEEGPDVGVERGGITFQSEGKAVEHVVAALSPRDRHDRHG